MNAKQVLNKIMTLLSVDEIKLTYAKLADGTIVESPTFDVGESLDVVSEDGTKTPAPDGFHDLKLEGAEGEEVYIKVKTEGGKIVERENVEMADASTAKVKDLPNTDVKDKANEVADIESPANNSKGLKPASMMAEETEEVETLPQDAEAPMKEEGDDEIEINLGDLKKKMEQMAYRIEEMEKKMMEMQKPMEEVVDKKADVKKEEDVKMSTTLSVDSTPATSSLDEEELPKLDGAPVEAKLSMIELNRKNFGKKSMNTQDSFLSKLYK